MRGGPLDGVRKGHMVASTYPCCTSTAKGPPTRRTAIDTSYFVSYYSCNTTTTVWVLGLIAHCQNVCAVCDVGVSDTFLRCRSLVQAKRWEHIFDSKVDAFSSSLHKAKEW